MVSDQHVIFSRIDQAIKRYFLSRPRQLHPEGISEISANCRHDQTSKHVLETDNLMIY